MPAISHAQTSLTQNTRDYCGAEHRGKGERIAHKRQNDLLDVVDVNRQIIKTLQLNGSGMVIKHSLLKHRHSTPRSSRWWKAKKQWKISFGRGFLSSPNFKCDSFVRVTALVTPSSELTPSNEVTIKFVCLLSASNHERWRTNGGTAGG